MKTQGVAAKLLHMYVGPMYVYVMVVIIRYEYYFKVNMAIDTKFNVSANIRPKSNKARYPVTSLDR